MLDAPMSNKQKCPLCGQPNRCAMAEGHSVGACWCVSITLTADMLEAVPPEDRGVRSICATCARALANDVANQTSSQDSVDPPNCPTCNSAMVIRTAHRGSNQGSKFWGCPRYPNCRGMRPF